MNRLNRKVEYALMALKVIASKHQGELTSAKEITELTGSPFDATARVLQQMTQSGLLRSEHGVHGGYLLLRDLNRVSFASVMEMILGPMAVAKCLTSEAECDLKSSCNIVSPVSILNRKLAAFYQNLTVGDLLLKTKVERAESVVEVQS